MRTLVSCAVFLVAVWVPLRADQKQSGANETNVTIQPASNSDLGYDLMHLEIVASGQLPSEGSDYGYRILSVHEQGNCVEMCPATLVYVLLGNVSGRRDEEKVKVYRIDGVRFMHFPKAVVMNPKKNAGFFLALHFTSMPHPDQPEHYIARIGSHGAIVEREGPDIPPPAHHFEQLFHRPGADVFKIKLSDGNVFRLAEFEIFDPTTYGQADAWSATVVESGTENPPDYRMDAGSHFGPFVEGDIVEILDEGLNKIVYQRKNDNQ